jgi:hypothetical protein
LPSEAPASATPTGGEPLIEIYDNELPKGYRPHVKAIPLTTAPCSRFPGFLREITAVGTQEAPGRLKIRECHGSGEREPLRTQPPGGGPRRAQSGWELEEKQPPMVAVVILELIVRAEWVVCFVRARRER